MSKWKFLPFFCFSAEILCIYLESGLECWKSVSKECRKYNLQIKTNIQLYLIQNEAQSFQPIHDLTLLH